MVHYERMRRRQLAIGDTVLSALPEVVREEFAVRFSRPDGEREMRDLIDGHWRRVLPDELITMGRFRVAWACALSGVRLAGLVERGVVGGRTPLLLDDGRFYGLGFEDGRNREAGDEEFASVVSEGVVLPFDAAATLWRAFRGLLAKCALEFPGIEVMSGRSFGGCIRLAPTRAVW